MTDITVMKIKLFIIYIVIVMMIALLLINDIPQQLTVY